MGLVYVDAVVKNSGVEVKVKLLVDSGATYTVLKREVWERLGLRPLGEVELVLADGTVIRRNLRLGLSCPATARGTRLWYLARAKTETS